MWFILYYCCSDTVKREATTITAVFPSPNEVMAILVQVCVLNNTLTLHDNCDL
jgi:exocyst complex component 5